MKTVPARVLSELGMAAFRTYLERGRVAGEPPPHEVLLSDDYSRRVEPEVELRVRKFSTKYEMGMEICTAFAERLSEMWNVDEFWAAMSLTFHASTFPVKNNEWFIGSLSRHLISRIPGRHQDQGHRHLVKGAASAVSRFGQEARVLMGGPHEQAKMEEQIMSRKSDIGLASSKEVVRAAYLLYYDPDKDVVRRGAKSTGTGSIMRLIDILKQLDVNYDVASLDAQEIVSLLPRAEFAKFLPESASIS
jgi:hypothetical protein